MIIVSLLQNQWFKDPDRVRKLYEKYPDKREELNKELLFMGSLTGKRLLKAFGQELIDIIVWEEVSRELGKESSYCFKPDYEHINQVLDKHSPDIIMTFGGVAEKAIQKVGTGRARVISFCHPAKRGLTNEDLVVWRNALEEIINSFGHEIT